MLKKFFSLLLLSSLSFVHANSMWDWAKVGACPVVCKVLACMSAKKAAGESTRGSDKERERDAKYLFEKMCEGSTHAAVHRGLGLNKDLDMQDMMVDSCLNAGMVWASDEMGVNENELTREFAKNPVVRTCLVMAGNKAMRACWEACMSGKVSVPAAK